MRSGIMKKILPFLLTAALVVACQEQQPMTAPDGVSVAFDISDGATGGLVHEFFFLPPLADHPGGNTAFDEGELNQFLNPFARICELQFPLPAPGTPRECERHIVTLPMDLDLANEQYKVNWKTSGFPLNDGYGYRIHVYVGSEPAGLLGYRDVIPLANPNTASCTSDPASDCQINNGANLPIKVWIGENAFCPEGTICQTRSFDLGDDGASFNLVDQFLLNVPTQPVPQQGTVTFQTCKIDNTANLIDLPLFGPCLETVLLSGEPIELDSAYTATISFCEVDIYSFGLTDPQPENLRVHHFRGPNGDQGVEALRVANDCPETTASLPSNPIERFASQILSWIGPRPLQASAVAGKGGFGGNSLETIGSKFRIALPAKIDFVDVADATRVALAGSPLQTRAIVTDLNGDPVAGATVRWNLVQPPNPPDEGDATVIGVIFEITECKRPTIQPGEIACLTDEDGIAQISWELAGDPGINKLTAGGRGIADSRDDFNGPRGKPDANGVVFAYDKGPFDPFQPIAAGENGEDLFVLATDEISAEIAENTRLLFTAIGCEAGFGTPKRIDGTMDPGEWDCAIQKSFPVNLSGGSTVDATLFYMNDNTDFHLAVVVPGTGRVNGLRVEWDSDGDGNAGGREVGDDIWEFDPDRGPADKFVDDQCSTSGQSGCGNNDAGFLMVMEPGVGMDTEAAFKNTVGGQTVYEMSHPLSTGQVCEILGRKGCSSGFPIDLQAAKGQTRGAYITLRLGSGAQGNTQWPGFLKYLMIEIK
jgi:hypothetical protein